MKRIQREKNVNFDFTDIFADFANVLQIKEFFLSLETLCSRFFSDNLLLVNEASNQINNNKHFSSMNTII